MSSFAPAVREKMKLRIGLIGATGSGKTLGSIRLAYGLCRDWSKIFLADADNRSSLGYAGDPVLGIGQFMFAPLEAPYTPQRYLKILKEAAAADAGVIIIDTLSQEWAGEGGIVEQHDQMSGNAYTNWGKLNPPHYELINWITHKAPCHVIVNFRAKMKYALTEEEEDGRKRTRVARLGEGPIMRPGTEYEFHLTLECNRDTYRAEVVTKRGTMLPDMRPVELTDELGQRLAAWAESGESMETLDQAKARMVNELKGLYPTLYADGKAIGAALKELKLSFDRVDQYDDIKAKLVEHASKESS